MINVRLEISAIANLVPTQTSKYLEYPRFIPCPPISTLASRFVATSEAISSSYHSKYSRCQRDAILSIRRRDAASRLDKNTPQRTRKIPQFDSKSSPGIQHEVEKICDFERGTRWFHLLATVVSSIQRFLSH